VRPAIQRPARRVSRPRPRGLKKETMTIAKRLIVLLAVPLPILVGLGIFVAIQLARIEDRSRFVAETQIGSLAAMENTSRSFMLPCLKSGM